ncbi:MAG: GNAT family N-acetyltransferase [Firmicutes bacterium]|nr:GNAT family N-acetyltransferase [Bacillota bacterium]
MVDKTVEVISVAMTKENLSDYPKYQLPVGYRFVMYQPGFDQAWARIETAVGEFNTVSDAVAYFHNEFMPYAAQLPRRCIFIQSDQGQVVATSSAWFGELFGSMLPRIHWVAVDPAHQGKGLGKALLTKTFQVFESLGESGQLYLTSRTWSWKAINIYLNFGFQPYLGEEPVNWNRTKVNFKQENELAWKIIFDKLNQE